MDNRSNPPTQGTTATKSTGCCGGTHKAEPLTPKEMRPAEDNKPEKTTTSGCCCSGD